MNKRTLVSIGLLLGGIIVVLLLCSFITYLIYIRDQKIYEQEQQRIQADLEYQENVQEREDEEALEEASKEAEQLEKENNYRQCYEDGAKALAEDNPNVSPTEFKEALSILEDLCKNKYGL